MPTLLDPKAMLETAGILRNASLFSNTYGYRGISHTQEVMMMTIMMW